MVLLAHISDIHIDDGERNAERTTRVFRYLAGLPTRPDAIVVTGDIADHGAEGEYERARALTESPIPVLFCPGNHDSRAPYRKALLGEEPADGPINRAYDVAGVRILLADSSIPGRNDGMLTDETLDWLAADLAEHPGRPTLIGFHHPPVVLGIPFIDNLRQFGAERLAALVERHPQVVALLCGHAHTPAVTMFAGRPLLTAPSTSSTLLLPFETEEIFDRTLPPMITFHLLDDDHRITSHYRVIP